MQPAEHFLTVPEHTDQYIYQHMRRHSLIHMETEWVDAQSFEDDLLLLQQDISSFEYLGRGGGSDVVGTAFKLILVGYI